MTEPCKTKGHISYFVDNSIPIQVGTARLLSGVTAEYKNELGEKYREDKFRLRDPAL